MTIQEIITKIKELCSGVIDSDFEPDGYGGTGKIEIWVDTEGTVTIGRWSHEDTQPTAEELAG